jgi:hydroxymethylbilane synthase
MVIQKIKEKYQNIDIEIVVIRTQGDKLLGKPLADFGGKGVFITEIEAALINGDIDLAVHSAKDMPEEISAGLEIAGVLPRDDARDVLVTRQNDANKSIENMIIGTGSLRRKLQLEKLYPGVRTMGIRGNVTTRLDKMRAGEYDGLVLAAAGLKRLNLLAEQDLTYHYFSYDDMVPAGGQGVIMIEGRVGDKISRLVSDISCKNTEIELKTERRILKLLGGSCHDATGAFAEIRGTQIGIRMLREEKGCLYLAKGRGTVDESIKLTEQLVKKVGING